MTPQEQQMLQGLTDRVNQTVLQDKDPEAEQYLTQSLGRNPDALYILAQTVLVQQYALDQAKKQLDEAKQQLAQAQQQAQQQPVKHTSFLGSLLGTDRDDEPRQAPPPAPSQGYQPVQGYSPAQPQYAPPPPQHGQPQYGQPVYQPGFGVAPPTSGGGFLRSAIQTAGGVAAGALAFEGIESLMHGFGEHAGYGGGGGFGMGGFGGGLGGGQPREEVVNNYYDGDRPGQDGVSRDIEDRRDDNNQRDFSGDAGDQNDNLDTAADDTADYGTDDSSGDMGSDESGGFDDSNS